MEISSKYLIDKEDTTEKSKIIEKINNILDSFKRLNDV